jgi:pilus assembly protein Flp/PilA
MVATVVSRWAFLEGELTMAAIKNIRQFLLSEDGPTAVEYAVMLALILVACITIVQSLGTSVSGTFSRVNASMGS